MKGEQIMDEEVEEEQRVALGQLRGHGKSAKVGSVRVGSAKVGGPGVLHSGSVKQPLKTNNGQGFAIYNDENNDPPRSVLGASSRSIPSSKDRKENELAAGQWGKARVSKGGNVPLNTVSQHSKPAFTVYEEPNLVQPAPTPQKHNQVQSNGLRTRKTNVEDHGTVHCPVALFEPPDPTKRAMYCKGKVYQGTTEFSFEEFRAIKWKARQKAREEAESMEKRKAELIEMEIKLREQQEAMAKQMAEFQRMMAGGTSALVQGNHGILLTRPSTSSDSSIEQVGEVPAAAKSASKKELSSENSSEPFTVFTDENGSASTAPYSGTDSELSQPKQPLLSRDNSLGNSFPSFSRQPSLDTTAALLSANPTGAKNKVRSTPSPHGLKGQAPVAQPSPTVNTREAMAVMQQLWSKPVGDEEQDQGILGPSNGSQFQIYSDSSEEQPDGNSVPFQIFSDEGVHAQGVPFSIYNDDSSKNGSSTTRPSQSCMDVRKEKSDDLENCPPMGYVQPPLGVRPKSGILTEAVNVEFVPLEEQERMLDEDERRQENAIEAPVSIARPTIPKPFAGNQTIALPDEEDFERMAKMSSTPFTGKPAFYCEQDENTCAVDIVYKTIPSTMGPPTVPSTFDHEVENGYSRGCRLDTIAETSREYCKSSSSSSGGDTLHHNSNRSHWGNTGSTQLHAVSNKTTDSTGISLARTPGQHLGSTSSVSGYLGDKSSMVKSSQKSFEKRDLVNSPHLLPYDKRLKMAQTPKKEENEFDEPTDMFGDMMAEYNQIIAKPKEQGDHEASLHASFSETKKIDRIDVNSSAVHTLTSKTDLNLTGVPPILSMTRSLINTCSVEATGLTVPLNTTSAVDPANMTGTTPSLNKTASNAPPLNITATKAPFLNMTATNAPSLNMTASNAPSLNMTANITDAAPALNVTGLAYPLNITSAPLTLNLTEAPSSSNLTACIPNLEATRQELRYSVDFPDLDVTKPSDNLVEMADSLSLDESVDPFHPETHALLLSKLPNTITSLHGYVQFEGRLPHVRVKSIVTLGDDVFYVSECKGEGAYAKVYAAQRQDNDMDCTISGIDAVLKVQKPANNWEFYVCKQVEKRLPKDILHGFMSIPRNYAFLDGGIFVSYHQKLGSLLDIINITKTSSVQKTCIEPMTIYFAIEMLTIMENLHQAGILHADIKAENFLLQNIPSIDFNAASPEEMFASNALSLQLIDFGRSIDLKLFPSDISFTKLLKRTESRI